MPVDCSLFVQYTVFSLENLLPNNHYNCDLCSLHNNANGGAKKSQRRGRMSATYHFHIQNFVQVSNSQIQQHSQGAIQNTQLNDLDNNHLKEILSALQHVQQQIVFDEE